MNTAPPDADPSEGIAIPRRPTIRKSLVVALKEAWGSREAVRGLHSPPPCIIPSVSAHTTGSTMAFNGPHSSSKVVPEQRHPQKPHVPCKSYARKRVSLAQSLEQFAESLADASTADETRRRSAIVRKHSVMRVQSREHSRANSIVFRTNSIVSRTNSIVAALLPRLHLSRENSDRRCAAQMPNSTETILPNATTISPELSSKQSSAPSSRQNSVSTPHKFEAPPALERSWSKLSVLRPLDESKTMHESYDPPSTDFEPSEPSIPDEVPVHKLITFCDVIIALGITMGWVGFWGWVSDEIGGSCATNHLSTCQCDDDGFAYSRLMYEMLNFGSRISWGYLVYTLIGEDTFTGPLIYAAAAVIVDYSLAIIMGPWGLDLAWNIVPAASIKLAEIVVMLICVWMSDAPRALCRRVYPIVRYIILTSFGASIVVYMCDRLLRDYPDRRAFILVSLPFQLSLFEYCVIRNMRRHVTTWSTGQIAFLGRSFVSAFEGVRVSSLLIAAKHAASPFDAEFLYPFLIAIPIDVLARNDMYIISMRKLQGWSDQRIRKKFTSIKCLFLASRSDASYMVFLVLCIGGLFGTLLTGKLMGCDGTLGSAFKPKSIFLLAIVIGEIVADVMGRGLNQYIQRVRPLLARDLSLEWPTRRSETYVHVWNSFYWSIVGFALMASMDAILADEG